MGKMSPNRRCGVYSITNSKNRKVYVGSSKDIHERWWRHKHDLKLNQHPNRYLQRSYNKHGKGVFIFKVIVFCEENERHALEEKWITHYKKRGVSYNIAPVEKPPVVHMAGKLNGMYRDDIPSPDELAEEYMSNHVSVNDLATKYKCGVNTIRRRLNKSNINTHKNSEQLSNYQQDVPSPEKLLSEYEKCNVTYEDLARKYNCTKSIINHRLRKVRGKTVDKHAHVPTGELLLHEYESSDITQKEMSKKYNCTVSCIEYRLKMARMNRLENGESCLI